MRQAEKVDSPGKVAQALDRLLATPAIDCSVALVHGLIALALVAPYL